MCLFCKLNFKIHQFFFFRKIRKMDYKKLCECQSFLENNPRSSFSLENTAPDSYFNEVVKQFLKSEVKNV